MIERLSQLWLGWFLIYMATGTFAMMQGRTGFFAETVDHVSWLWVELTFLNIPLQIVLALTAIQLNRSSATGARRVGNVVAVVTTILIAVHIVISVAIEMTQ